MVALKNPVQHRNIDSLSAYSEHGAGTQIRDDQYKPGSCNASVAGSRVARCRAAPSNQNSMHYFATK